jgi:DNA-binding GntR family transcriptional regulator
MIRERQSAEADLGTQAYEQTRELIAIGRLAPGARIIESDLADHLQISRTPVRGALKRLQQEGWLVGSGSGKQLRLSVSPLTEDDARELFDIIGTLEGLAARRAASLSPAERSVLVQELRAINDTLRDEAASPRSDPTRVYQLHSAFHVHLVAAIHAPRLQVLHEAIKPQAYRYRQAYSVALVAVTATAAAEHAALLLDIQAGDSVRAEAAARANWSNAAERMAGIIRTWGEKGSW